MVSKRRSGINRDRSNLVIGLTGPFGSGCSTMRHILAQTQFGFHPFKMADDIRSEVDELGRLIPKGQKGWRRVLQEHGDARRRERTGYWIDKVVKRIDDAQIGQQGIVIDGFRNFTEVQEIRNTAQDFVPLMSGEKAHRDPRAAEIHIAAAYAQSHASTCLKRHVGAVITVTRNGHEFPISMGFNENPPSVRTCKSESTCYKDDDMISKLEARGKKIHCPVCGTLHEGLGEPWNCSECGTSLKAWLHPNRNMELCTAIHAEERAVLSLGGRSAEGGTLYVTTFPCFQCARLILDAGIKNLVYVEAYPVKDTAVFLKKNGIEEIRPFSGFTARAFFRVFPKVN